jgi:hypothetical protein
LTSCDVTRRELTLGARDPVTGHCAKEWAETTIKGVIRPRGASFSSGGVGYIAKYPHTFFTNYVIAEGDEIKDAWNRYYQIHTVEPDGIGDSFNHYTCNAEKLEFHSDLPASYGTGAAVNDSRYNQKLFLDTKIDDSNLTDNAGAEVDWFTCFDNIPYPVSRELLPAYNDMDLIFAISPSTADALLNGDMTHTAYATHEKCPVTTYVADKAGITAENLKNKAEQELRRIIGLYPLGSVRSLGGGKPKQVGVYPIYAYEYIIDYRRSNETSTGIGLTFKYSGSTYTFTIPNCVHFEFTPPPRNIGIGILGRITNAPQGLGAEDAILRITCDLDIAPLSVVGGNTNRWKRNGGSQTTNSKTDFVAGQIFMEMAHNEATGAEPYQTLNVGWMEFKVKLSNDSPHFYFDGERNLVDVTFLEYSETSKSGQTVVERFGLTG